MRMKLSLRVIYLGCLDLFVVVLLLTVGTANYAPYSGRAYVEYGEAPVFSKVSAVIEELYCRDGQQVEKGDPLFRLDDRNFRAEVERLEALYETTVNKLAALDCQIAEQEEDIRRQEKTCEKCRIDFERDRTLLDKQAVAAKTFENSRLQFDIAAGELAAMRSRLNALKRQRGRAGDDNSELKQLRAELAVARNRLDDTVIRAPIAGLLSCHQLHYGQMILTAERYAVIHETGNLTINADLMEKSVGRLQIGQKALVAFDAIPGRVFQASLKGVVRELRSGYVAPNEFHEIAEDTRWIRTVGRNRIQLSLEEPMPPEVLLTSGSKAAVSLQNPAHAVFSGLSNAWIRLISVCNYLY